MPGAYDRSHLLLEERRDVRVGHRRRLLAPVRRLLVLHDAPEEEQEQRDYEDAEADDLLLRPAVDAARAGDLEPADPDDLEDDEGGRQRTAAIGTQYDGELDRTRPVRPDPSAAG